MRNHYKKEKSFAQVFKEGFGFTEIGGIADTAYRLVRYDDYMFEDGVTIEKYNLINEDMIVNKNPLSMPTLDDDNTITGKKLLISLLKLADDIDKNCKTKYETVDKIIEWCKKVAHPYDINKLYEKYEADLLGIEPDIPIDLVYDGSFKYYDFMQDLCDLYDVVINWHAFSELIRGNVDYAYNLNDSGPSFINGSIYEKYKRVKNDRGINLTREDRQNWIKDNYTGDFIETLIKEREAHNIYGDLLSKETFRKNVLKDKKKIYSRIISYIPPVRMKLKYIDNEGNAEFRAEINSVFDICWYTLARMIASNAPQQDEDLDYGGDRWNEGTLGVCANCGTFFLKNNSVQKYCDNASCKAARIRNNVRSLRERRKNNQE
ncbi:MAG: hypothetical protein ACOX02_05280 [Acholeplasmatales bacterium]